MVIQVVMVDDGGERGGIEGEEDRSQDKTLRDVTGKFDRIGLHFVGRHCLYRYNLNQARAVLWIPNVYSRRVRRMVWSIVSKAAERSRSVRSETFPELEARSESFTI